MANRPSHPTCSPRAPIPHTYKAASCDPPSADPVQPAHQQNFSPSDRYQLFSALRTTDEKPIKVEDDDSHSECSSEGKQSCCSMNVPVPLPCEECVQECEEGSCDLPLTEQCTDQCVVVPCNDAHHGYVPCEEANVVAGCDIICTDDPDCDALATIMQCCPEYRHLFTDPRPQSHGQYGWSGLADQFFPSYPASSSVHEGHNHFYGGYSMSSASLLTNSPPSLLPTPHSASPISPMPPVQSVGHGHDHPSSGLACMWGNCGATFATMYELVGHVNLQHLRLPSNAAVHQPSSQSLPRNDPSSLSCLWADCQVYPTPHSVPGPSMGNQTDNVLGILASHLLQDHLGLAPSPSPSNEAESRRQESISPPISCPPTPAPEHDCSAPQAHVCRWSECGEGFSSCDALTTHINSAHVGSGKAHYDCYWQGCSRHGENGFASKQKICRHLQSHTGHRPFQCKICQQNFSEAATLAQHMRRHTQEKPYVCDFPGCGKSFAITGALTIHKRTHNGHKPFKCTFCDRAFTESSNLSKHLRTHTGVKPYLCAEPGCSKTFARPDQLARHMSVHRKKEPEGVHCGDVKA